MTLHWSIGAASPDNNARGNDDPRINIVADTVEEKTSMLVRSLNAGFNSAAVQLSTSGRHSIQAAFY